MPRLTTGVYVTKDGQTAYYDVAHYSAEECRQMSQELFERFSEAARLDEYDVLATQMGGPPQFCDE